MEVSIISGDRDLLQLATEKVKIRIPKTKRTGTEIEDYYAADVLERYQVTPKEFIDVKALMGDSSDNIPGVPGIGEKGRRTSSPPTGALRTLTPIWRRSNRSGRRTRWRSIMTWRR